MIMLNNFCKAFCINECKLKSSTQERARLPLEQKLVWRRSKVPVINSHQSTRITLYYNFHFICKLGVDRSILFQFLYLQNVTNYKTTFIIQFTKKNYITFIASINRIQRELMTSIYPVE